MDDYIEDQEMIVENIRDYIKKYSDDEDQVEKIESLFEAIHDVERIIMRKLYFYN